MIYTRNGKKIEFFFLTGEDFNSKEYYNFINSTEYRKFMHITASTDLFTWWKNRINYYKSLYSLKILGVKIDGLFVGQSCAVQVYAIVNNQRKEFWWSVDTFLLSNCRGLGIGKELQKILHMSLPNFSSAWYTPINGAIKRKCGAHGIFDIWFNYYPVSSAVTVFGDLCFRKLFKCPIPLRISVPFFYSGLNSISIDIRLKGYKVMEILYSELGCKESVFMEGVLAAKDFHIERSERFLKWKYQNLRVGYHMLNIAKEGRTEAIVAFSNIYDSRFDEVPIKCVTIYDMVIHPESKLTEKQLMLYIAQWYKKRKEKFDGFQMLSKVVGYWGKICYPFNACPVLSTLPGEYPNSYLTFADQDMDQI